MPSPKKQPLCPICGKPVDFMAEPLGPFCSSRCKMVDLGRWFGEDYRFSDPLRPDNFAQYEELAEGSDPDCADEG